MPRAHRDGDPRACGATTIAVGQSTTFVNGILWSVAGDPNTDGGGALIPTCGSVFIQGIPVIVHSPDPADADSLCPIFNAAHCLPETAGGSPNVSACG